jgi:hypothetical protein
VRTRLAVAAAALSAAATVLGAVVSARATTVPGKVYVSPLVIYDKAVKVRIRHNTWRDTIRYLRGAEVRYEVVNRGTRAYSLDILGSVTGRIEPGRHATILVYWGRRGSFVFRAAPRGARLRVVVD